MDSGRIAKEPLKVLEPGEFGQPGEATFKQSHEQDQNDGQHEETASGDTHTTQDTLLLFGGIRLGIGPSSDSLLR